MRRIAKKQCKGCARLSGVGKRCRSLIRELTDFQIHIESECERVERKLSEDLINAVSAAPKEPVSLDEVATETLFELGREHRTAGASIAGINTALSALIGSFIQCKCGRRDP